MTGETLTEAILASLKERLERLRSRRRLVKLSDSMMEIGRRCAALPVIDDGDPDEVIGYGKDGAPS